MTAETIQRVQEYLTVSQDDRKRKIIDVEALLVRHGPDPVLRLLTDLFKQKGKKLIDLIAKDKSKSKIDETIAAMFRIYMAIKVIEKEREEVREICPS